MSRRNYDSSRRNAAAAQAQQRVVAAAGELLRHQGYAATTVADIAAAAQVSAALIYSAFGNKAGLLKRLLDVSIAGDHEPVALRDRPAVAAIKAAKTARRRCELNAELISDVLGRVAPLWEVVRDAAGIDVDVAAILARQDHGRRVGMSEFVDILADDGQIRAGLDRDRATDAVWALTDPGTYHRLVVQRGWQPTEYQHWLARTMLNSVT
jgi:AcrR family transcriptional regulator